ncbi:uncharacterized protein LOC101459872 [Ceratitis capitata]|uniref:uncharacterized protein LOC101459872 n=1 Tax=Ceratitis capitata TaxID=7213 RepID=UPI0006188BC8|nr:uncharacterized protein LOC101459872 [Ceratitis capitata]XP_020717335.1 uncharacterized protein LOC101459872 [Ceratitis capitata]XP_020717336.1 uncharacterized protein LOC101459872 [Ceratitis capitata]
MTENKDKTATAGTGGTGAISKRRDSSADENGTEITQDQQTTAVGCDSTKPKDKKNDSETTVAVADTQHEREKDKEAATTHDRTTHKDEFGTQKVYKKTSPNCVLTLYLPSREITLSGNNPAILRGIIFVDPKAIQGYRVYAQLTLTFRFGREDEEVMGLRFCNEAIMSLHQVWPRKEEPTRESLSPLQEALVKRLGDGAHPFTLTLTPQAPPSVHLVPAKRYYGAPIGTSYDVRCFIADKTDEKFHRRATVQMGVRVIYRTDVYHQSIGPENFTALINNQGASPPLTAALTSPPSSSGAQNDNSTSAASAQLLGSSISADSNASFDGPCCSGAGATAALPSSGERSPAAAVQSHVKPRKSERGDSFPKLRLSPKTFRFSGRFGRSKSEIEKCPSDPFNNYSKSFQEYDCTAIAGGIGAVGISGISGGGGGSGIAIAPHAASPGGVGCVVGGSTAPTMGGPQGAVDKPFLLQDGRVGLRASLDKAWYTHGEDVCVTVNIKNDSRKTVRKMRVSAIQHVDVCMFSNGKFKNIVADSDTSSPVDRIVPPGSTLNTTVILKPKRGKTKNWIALEDPLQRSTEPDEVPSILAASAVNSPNVIPVQGQLMNPTNSSIVGIPQQNGYHGHGMSGVVGDDRNIFAIYVSYYVKVKLSLSPMGGELSLKLPFVLVHVEVPPRLEPLALDAVPVGKRNCTKARSETLSRTITPRKDDNGRLGVHAQQLDRIESVDDESVRLPIPEATNAAGAVSNKRRLVRSETLAKDLDEEIEEQAEVAAEKSIPITVACAPTREAGGLEQIHVVQIHSNALENKETEFEKDKQRQTLEVAETKMHKDLVEPQLEVDIQRLSLEESVGDEAATERFEKTTQDSSSLRETPNHSVGSPQASQV